MKKKIVFLFICVFLISLFIFNKIYYRDEVPFLCPLELNSKGILIRNDGFGEGYFGAKRKDDKTHKGVDILAAINTPVRAVKSGWAVSSCQATGYGNLVKIIHPHNLETRYAHLDEINIGWIKKVRQGEVIGTVGKSGNADYQNMKAHLHFEVRVDGEPKDPMKLLSEK